MFAWLSDDGQRLYNQPGRIVGVFYGELLLSGALGEQLRQVDALYAGLVLTIGNSLGDILTVGKDGEIVLFAVAETFAYRRHFTDEQ